MSDSPQAEGWWQASDGKWYPPEQHPDAAAQSAPSAEDGPVAGAGGPPGEGYWQASDGQWYAPELHPDAQEPDGLGGADQPATSGRETIFMPGAPATEGPSPAATPPPGQPRAEGAPAASSPPPASPPPSSAPPASPPPASPPPSSPPPASPPPAAPPGGGPPPGAAGGGGKKRGTGRIVLIILLVLALALAAFAVNAFFFGDEASADAVVLEAIGEDRADPFTDAVAPEPAGSLADYAASSDDVDHGATTELVGYQAPDGSVPGVYGGSLNEAGCEPDVLERFLLEEPDKAQAWAGVIQISAGDVPAYLAGLTPVNLASDTRVVNHGFVDGEATPRQAVLQRGSAVLVDARGVPRVDCYSGGPLLEPQPLEAEEFSGSPWENFQRERVIAVREAGTDLDSLELRDIESGELFTRPVGSRGEADGAQDVESEDTGTVDLVDDGPIEFDRVYEDAIVEGRSEARYLLDAPNGAIMTFRVDNPRESENRVRARIASEGSNFGNFRVPPGASEEVTVILDHEGGAPFELLFDEGPAAYDFEVTLQGQQDAGQQGDAGGDFGSAFDITAGQPVQGLLGGQDSSDRYLVEVQPGSEMVFNAEVTRESANRARFRIELEGESIFGERVQPGSSTEGSELFSGDDGGTLEILVDEGGADYTFVLGFVEQADGGQPGDAGDTLADARDLTVGDELTGQVGDRDPSDWYVFEAPAANLEVAVVNDVNSANRVRVRIEDDSGSSVTGGRINPGSEDTLAFEAEEGAEYRLYFDEGRAQFGFQVREMTGPDGS